MNLSNRDTIEVVAVFIGSILLVGPLTYTILLATADIIGRVFWMDTAFPEILKIGTNVVIFLLTLIVIEEAIRIQLFGYETLQRGSIYRQLSRHTVLIILSFSLFIVAIFISYNIILTGLRDGNLVISSMGFAISLSLIYILVRGGVVLYKTISKDYLIKNNL